MIFRPVAIGMFGLAITLALSGCASGPKYSVASSSFPSLAASQGRIYFYRPSALGAAVQPDIKLNGEKVGTAKPHGFYFVDREPGSYEVTAATETEKKLTFVLESGQERYVRLKIQMGILVGRIVPELVDKSEAETEINDLSYIAQPLK
jgi:Protein of unknown function (DUF2846)